MTLPGKLTIAVLEEDNPIKSYFRVRPLFYLDNGIVPIENAQSLFPSDGCLRIVPDKNESSHFKVRMREMGAFCAVDLRLFTNENEKIRVNKNYGEAGNGDANSMIVYSDVIVEAPKGMIAELVSDPKKEAPQTQMFFIEKENSAEGPWTVVNGEMCKAEGYRFGELPVDRYEIYDVELPVGRRKILIDTKGKLFESSSQDKMPETVAETKEEKSYTVDAAAKRIQYTERSGLNPRRKNTIYEIIDSEWSRSRLDQLGTPVPGAAKGMPVETPVEQALSAVKSIIGTPAGSSFMAGLKNIEGFEKLFDGETKPASGISNARDADELEAVRLKLAKEIDDLKRRKTQECEAVAEEIKKARGDETRKYEAALNKLRSQLKDADESLRKANAASREIEKQCGEKIAAAFAEYRMFESAGPNGITAGMPETVEMSGGQLVSYFRSSFEKAGFPIDNNTACAVLSALANNRILIFSGKTGSGKTEFARLLIKTLGYAVKDAPVSIIAARDKWADDVRSFMTTAHGGSTPHVVFIDDANLRTDIVTDILAFCEDEAYSSVRFVLTVQDDGFGYALAPALLDRAAFIRLYGTEDDAAIFDFDRTEPSPDKAVSLDTLQAVFDVKREIPTAVKDEFVKKIAAIRKAGFTVTLRAARAAAGEFAALSEFTDCGQKVLLDKVIAERMLPYLLATGTIEDLRQLGMILTDMPECVKLMKEPLPLPPL